MEFMAYLNDEVVAGQGLEAKLLYTVLALLLFWLIRQAVLLPLLRGREVQVQYRIRKAVTYSTWALSFLVIGRIWFAGFESVST